ncbi:hypothetical protein PF006_g18109 [Phytophthora fragariae]|uniref:Uncharacterized protein n=1 Tax=Phytophthora fragariae TaxID=53985 RepID=A0A6A3SNH8_9STRA|nr:hypothetical protein PF006_g18109 [Phytophthora fragariae]
MIASGDVEFEGVTTFAKDSSTNYRYTVALKDNKLNFSLEDCSIKKQWFKGGMDKADYVTTDNAISGASPADYLKCFHNALSCALEGSNDSQRKLKSKLCDQQAELKKIAVLETTVKEQQEELKKMQSIHTTANSVVELESTGTYIGSATLRWTTPESKCDAFNAFVNVCGGGGVLAMRRSGIYIVWPTVKRVPLDNSDDDTEDDDEDLCVRLLKNGECIEVGYLVEEINFVSLIAIGRFQEGDKLAVTTDFAMEGTSTLYIVRLGN